MTFKTTLQYWDCDCEHDYIHPANIAVCSVCKYEREDGPDARVTEVQALGFDVSTVTCARCSNISYNQLVGDTCNSCHGGIMQ